MSMELLIEQPRPTRNKVTGRFLKGHVPHNKGKKCDEWMDGRKQKRVKRIAVDNLNRNRNKNGRPDNAGRCRKKVVAVTDDGTMHVFSYVGAAAQWIGGSRENVGRCCRYNAARHVDTRSGNINTDHRYKGVRWYFESDPIWVSKISKN